MIQQIWSKQIPLLIELAQEDIADQSPPLPLFLMANWHHYIGFYLTPINRFFQCYQPFPYDQSQLWLEVNNQHHTQLSNTDIIAHLWVHHTQPAQPLKLICHFRKVDPTPPLDLKTHFKTSLKASTCVRYGRFGAGVITVQMPAQHVQAMFKNFKDNDMTGYMGSTQPQGGNLGYHFIVSQQDRKASLPVRIKGKDFMIERKVAHEQMLSEFWSNIVGDSRERVLCLHGVPLKDLSISFHNLQQFCHPDGFLYLTV